MYIIHIYIYAYTVDAGLTVPHTIRPWREQTRTEVAAGSAQEEPALLLVLCRLYGISPQRQEGPFWNS